MGRRAVVFGLLLVGSLIFSLVPPVQPAIGVSEMEVPNGGFEDGTVGLWQGTQNDGGDIGNGSIQAVMSSTDARTGDWLGRVTYTEHGGGATLTLSGLIAGEEYSIAGYLKDATASGQRFRAGVEGAESASHNNFYEEGGIFWAELANVAPGTGMSDGTYQQLALHFVPAQDSVRIFVIFEDTFSSSGEFLLDDWDATIDCDDHCDCAQGDFCHRGECRSDVEPVYKCDQPGCMPGGWCVECDGRRSTCEADPDWHCDDACNCGPGWCCKDGECFEDTDDPYLGLFGGDVLASPCVQGVDATYCQDSASCWPGQLAWLDAGIRDDFRCVDPDTGEVTDTCRIDTCFFDCAAGLTCLDLQADDPRRSDPGVLTSLRGGGCVSSVLAEAVFGWSPSELLDSCYGNVLPGEPCVAGWRPGNTVLIERIVGEDQSCGNGTCEFLLGETSANCSDCSCGDGFCDTSEVGTCTADCGICDENGCEEPVMPLEWSALSACGDGVCQCNGAVAENATNCPDCRDAPDNDSDGVPDQCDGCPLDDTKTEPGVCGCGQPETDSDADGVLDCVDNCPDTANTDQADFDSDGVGDACDPDRDGDGVANADDICPWSMLGVEPADLKKNRYFADVLGLFVDVNGDESGFSIADTFGCDADQISKLLDLGGGHEKFGITQSALLDFIEEYQQP